MAGGTCFDEINGFRCACVEGFNGNSCQFPDFVMHVDPFWMFDIAHEEPIEMEVPLVPSLQFEDEESMSDDFDD